jgi:Cd2+/Zn2+-exporting ATPase
MSDCCGNRNYNAGQGKEEAASASGRFTAFTPLSTKAACQNAEVTAPSQQKAGSASDQRTRILIKQMDCPVEETLIRKKLGAMPGISALEFNLIQRVLTVTHAPEALEPLLAAIRSLDFEPELVVDETSSGAPPEKMRIWPLALAGIAAAAAEIAHWSGLPGWVQAVLALLAIAVCGLDTYKKGWTALRNANLNINALMSIAVTGALALGQWPEAAMVMVLFTLAEMLEAKSLDRARNAIGSLMQLAPETVSVQQPDGTWQEKEVKSVAPGSLIRVKPGERIGLDGTIVRGQSAINQAPVTGESLPVEKQEGDTLFAGTLNGAGVLEYRVTSAAADSTLARIIRVVEQAQGAKAPVQRFVDRFSRIYTPLVCALALAVALLPPLIIGGEWREWIYKALVMLVIACPCALVISTPVTIVSGLTAAARRGILIKGGVYLEQGRRLKWLALDKTGTLTHGKPVQTDIIPFGSLDAARCQTLAASLAEYSDHPVSQAVLAAAQSDRLPVAQFTALSGRGVCGVIQGVSYSLGNLRLMEERVNCPDAVKTALAEQEKQGKTVVMLCSDSELLSLFAVADTIKESSREAIAQLHQLGVRMVMLTGDNQGAAQAIAAQVAVDEVHSNQLPEDKLAAVENLAGRGAVGMVGDGINDAPALARADIGFAMGAIGTDTAIETADIALMDDDLRKIPAFVRLSKRTSGVLWQNIVLAMGIKIVFLALTLAGMGSLWMAVFADVGASLLVVANGLRLLRQ